MGHNAADASCCEIGLAKLFVLRLSVCVCVCVCVCVFCSHHNVETRSVSDYQQHALPDRATKLSARSKHLCFETECRPMDRQISPLNVKHKPRLD
jgi:hypothetical protein